MPTMASIIVKKADETTNITYDALSASGGDGSPAVWRQDTGANAALPTGLRAMFKAWCTWNGPKTARQMKLNFVMPYALQDSTTTKYSASDRVVMEVILTVPQAIPSAIASEGVYQGLNLAAATLVKQIGSSGYSAS